MRYRREAYHNIDLHFRELIIYYETHEIGESISAKILRKEKNYRNQGIFFTIPFIAQCFF